MKLLIGLVKLYFPFIPSQVSKDELTLFYFLVWIQIAKICYIDPLTSLFMRLEPKFIFDSLSFIICTVPIKPPIWLYLPYRSVFTFVPKSLKGSQINGISKTTSQVVVFHWRSPQLTQHKRVVTQSQARIKFNKVFFTHWFFQWESR